MSEILDIQKQLVPDLTEVMRKRYTILHHIQTSGLVGRRTLAGALNMTERVVRGEVDFLKAQGLVDIETSGIRVSEEGKRLLERIGPVYKQLFGLNELEERIRRMFGLKHVAIVPGDSDISPHTKKELGRAGAALLRNYAAGEEVIAVTGGSTVALVAEYLVPSAEMKRCWFVPARGGLGENVEFQANSVASAMAKKTGANYRLLHVPDQLGEEVYQTLLHDGSIREILEFIRTARIVVHGIGEAMAMARRRKAAPSALLALQSEGALAEAFGYYFDGKGRIVHKMPTVGLKIEDIQKMDVVIGIAGGHSKGKAIASWLQFGHEDALVTDEAAALEIVKHGSYG